MPGDSVGRDHSAGGKLALCSLSHALRWWPRLTEVKHREVPSRYQAYRKGFGFNFKRLVNKCAFACFKLK